MDISIAENRDKLFDKIKKVLNSLDIEFREDYDFLYFKVNNIECFIFDSSMQQNKLRLSINDNKYNLFFDNMGVFYESILYFANNGETVFYLDLRE